MDRYGLKSDVTAFILGKAKELSLNKVILFGSRARGDYSEKSDIDLAISGEGIHPFIDLLEEECPTLLSFDFIDLSDNLDEGFKARILAEGIVLYEQI